MVLPSVISKPAGSLSEAGKLLRKSTLPISVRSFQGVERFTLTAISVPSNVIGAAEVDRSKSVDLPCIAVNTGRSSKGVKRGTPVGKLSIGALAIGVNMAKPRSISRMSIANLSLGTASEILITEGGGSVGELGGTVAVPSLVNVIPSYTVLIDKTFRFEISDQSSEITAPWLVVRSVIVD